MLRSNRGKKSNARKARGANRARSVNADGSNGASNMGIIGSTDTQVVFDPMVQNISTHHEAGVTEDTGGLQQKKEFFMFAILLKRGVYIC